MPPVRDLHTHHAVPAAPVSAPQRAASASTMPAPRSAAFQSLLKVAQQTRQQTQGLDNPDALRQMVYQCLVYFPYTPAQALDLQQQASARIAYNEYGIALIQLQQEFAGSLDIFLQREQANARFITPAQAHISGNPGLMCDPWHIRLKNSDSFRRVSGANGVEAQLCFKLLPRYTQYLLPALAKAFTSPEAYGFASAKTMDRISHDARSQTGFIYLSENDPQAAATMAELTHRYLLQEVAADLGMAPEAIDLRMIYGPTVGTQFVRPGVGYIEKNARAVAGRSTGESVSDVITSAIEDSRRGKPLEIALAERLDQNGQAANPAFVKRRHPGELQIEPFIDILQSKTPRVYSESSFRNVLIPTRTENGNARSRFDNLAGYHSQAGA